MLGGEVMTTPTPPIVIGYQTMARKVHHRNTGAPSLDYVRPLCRPCRVRAHGQGDVSRVRSIFRIGSQPLCAKCAIQVLEKTGLPETSAHLVKGAGSSR